jgi:hypothetical protein
VSIVTLDDLNYDTDLMSQEAQAVLGLVVLAQEKLNTATAEVTILQAASASLIAKLNDELTEEMIATEEVEQTEE